MWPDRIELACSTLNYRAFPFRRALEGIRRAGFDFIGFGTTHEGAHVPNCGVTAHDFRGPCSI